MGWAAARGPTPAEVIDDRSEVSTHVESQPPLVPCSPSTGRPNDSRSRKRHGRRRSAIAPPVLRVGWPPSARWRASGVRDGTCWRTAVFLPCSPAESMQLDKACRTTGPALRLSW